MDRLLVDFDEAGQASVFIAAGRELPQPVGEPIRLEWPMSAPELEDLRWYLEDYLRAPFSVYESRGLEIASRLPVWGQAMFSSLFGSGPARDAYLRLRDRSAAGELEVVVRSMVPAWLGLPWELLRDPDRPVPLALDGVQLTRSLRSAQWRTPFEVRGDRLRVLMVISRPQGRDDVGFQMVARPLLHRLDAVRGRVEVTVLRPPTLDALVETLQAAEDAGTPFQVVHFDGHGVLTGPRAGGRAPLSYDTAGDEGVLVFEKPAGGAEHVPAARIARVLADAQVPVVVLNACQSGAVGKQLEAAVATRLLSGGASAVVAMAYSVYAVAAAEFMAAFYERLFAGDTVGEAVRAGRVRMGRRPDRPSPKGDLPLEDWTIPVHYLRQEVHFPDLRTQTKGVSLDDALDRIRSRDTSTTNDPLAAVGEFVGRDEVFYSLELAARTQRVIVLHGPAGTGKTEAVKAFGRWWRDTGGVDDPALVLWHSFAPGVASFGLDGVLSAIGLSVFGEQFSPLDRDERREVIVDLLSERRLLLIWDNFETVASMPDPTAATPPLDADSRAEIKDFLDRVTAGGRSTILITSRTPENWLGDDQHRVRVGGLNRHEAVQYADQVLARFSHAADRRKDRAFADLLDWLHGHPLSMRLILPHLDTANATTILDSLNGTAVHAELIDSHDGRLAASITYSINHLAPDVRRRLTAVCLFHGVVDATLLGLFSADAAVPPQFAGLDDRQWNDVLAAAAHVGLLTPLGNGMYTIHPALPAYLTTHWRADSPDEYTTQRATSENALLKAYASLGRWLISHIDSGDAAFAYFVIGLQRRTMGRLLGYALATGQWSEVQAVAEPLNDYWNRGGLNEEARAWTDRVRLALEKPDGTPPPLDQHAGQLWLFTVSAEAVRLNLARQLDASERTYKDIHDMLRAQPESDEQRRRLAPLFHQLGVVAQLRGRLDDAEQWYQQALSVKQELGNRSSMAASYHQLGMVAQDRGHFDKAEQWYHQALTIFEELDNQLEMAATYHQLGVIAQLQGRLDEAERRYREALTIREKLGNRPDIAASYQLLGMLARDRGHLADSELWNRRALTILEQLGTRPAMAITYRNLGKVAQDRGHLGEAEQWYHQALTIEVELNNRPYMAVDYQQLGTVAQQRGHFDKAEQWYHQALTIFEELDNRLLAAVTYHELGVTAQLQGRLDEAERRYREAITIFEDVGDQPGLATAYHQVGRVAQDRGHLDEAEQWYRRSLSVEEALGNRPGVAVSCLQLGVLVEQSGHLDQALDWVIRCVSAFDEFPDPGARSGPDHLARLTHLLDVATLEQRWQAITNRPLPADVRAYVEAYEEEPPAEEA